MATDNKLKLLLIHNLESDVWTLHALDYPIFSQGITREAAIEIFDIMMLGYIHISMMKKTVPFLNTSKSGEMFFDMWDRAKPFSYENWKHVEARVIETKWSEENGRE